MRSRTGNRLRPFRRQRVPTAFSDTSTWEKIWAALGESQAAPAALPRVAVAMLETLDGTTRGLHLFEMREHEALNIKEACGALAILLIRRSIMVVEPHPSTRAIST